jgi:hypothetical protein
MSQDPSGLGPDTNPYRYVGNSPTNFVDPSGLAVYWQNRELGNDSWLPTTSEISHTFLYTTDCNAMVLHTYSWGDEGQPHWWKDRPEDVRAAKYDNWLRNWTGQGRGSSQVGGDDLNPFVDDAFNDLNKPGSPSDHPWGCTQSCKHETYRLTKKAYDQPNAPPQKYPVPRFPLW